MREITFNKSKRTKRVNDRLAKAFVDMGIARYVVRPAATVDENVEEFAPEIPIPEPAPLMAATVESEPATDDTPPATVIPPEAHAAAAKVGGVVMTAESEAIGKPAPAHDGKEDPPPPPDTVAERKRARTRKDAKSEGGT